MPKGVRNSLSIIAITYLFSSIAFAGGPVNSPETCDFRQLPLTAEQVACCGPNGAYSALSPMFGGPGCGQSVVPIIPQGSPVCDLRQLALTAEQIPCCGPSGAYVALSPMFGGPGCGDGSARKTPPAQTPPRCDISQLALTAEQVACCGPNGAYAALSPVFGGLGCQGTVMPSTGSGGSAPAPGTSPKVRCQLDSMGITEEQIICCGPNGAYVVLSPLFGGPGCTDFSHTSAAKGAVLPPQNSMPSGRQYFRD
jgi:hypothetical protein